MRRGRILILFALILLFGAVAGFLVLSRLGGGGGTLPSPKRRRALPLAAKHRSSSQRRISRVGPSSPRTE